MTNTVKGRVQAVSDKQEDDYFGICIDDDWFNGPGSLKKNLVEAEVKLTVNTDDGFIDIEEISILEEASKGAESAVSDAGNGRGESSNSGGKTSSPNPKRANIQATAATKKAAEIVAKHRTNEPGEFEDEVSIVAHGLNQIMNDIYDVNMQ